VHIFALANDKFKFLRTQVIQENVTMKSTINPYPANVEKMVSS